MHRTALMENLFNLGGNNAEKRVQSQLLETQVVSAEQRKMCKRMPHFNIFWTVFIADKYRIHGCQRPFLPLLLTVFWHVKGDILPWKRPPLASATAAFGGCDGHVCLCEILFRAFWLTFPDWQSVFFYDCKHGKMTFPVLCRQWRIAAQAASHWNMLCGRPRRFTLSAGTNRPKTDNLRFFNILSPKRTMVTIHVVYLPCKPL